MPNYGFVCEKCNHKFDSLLSISDREKPLNEPCPSCKKKKIKRNYDDVSVSVASDTTMSANKATGGRWNHLMEKIKRKTPKRVHKNLDKASSLSGKQWRG